MLRLALRVGQLFPHLLVRSGSHPLVRSGYYHCCHVPRVLLLSVLDCTHGWQMAFVDCVLHRDLLRYLVQFVLLVHRVLLIPR